MWIHMRNKSKREFACNWQLELSKSICQRRRRIAEKRTKWNGGKWKYQEKRILFDCCLVDNNLICIIIEVSQKEPRSYRCKGISSKYFFDSDFETLPYIFNDIFSRMRVNQKDDFLFVVFIEQKKHKTELMSIRFQRPFSLNRRNNSVFDYSFENSH